MLTKNALLPICGLGRTPFTGADPHYSHQQCYGGEGAF